MLTSLGTEVVISRLYPTLFWNWKHLIFRMDFGWHCYLPLPPLPASLCSLTRTCHQPQSPWLWMEAVVSLAVTGTVSPMPGVGSAFWVLREMFFPACAVAEPEESPFLLHPGPDGVSPPLPSLQCPVPNPTAAAEKASRCYWHTSGTCKGTCSADLPQNTSDHALAMQRCRKPPTGEKRAFILVPAAVWLRWTPVRSRALLMACFAVKLVGD